MPPVSGLTVISPPDGKDTENVEDGLLIGPVPSPLSKPTMVSLSVSGSLSLGAIMLDETEGLSAVTRYESSSATGGSFSPVISMQTSADADAPTTSHTKYVKHTSAVSPTPRLSKSPFEVEKV